MKGFNRNSEINVNSDLFSINDLVNHYRELEHKGQIKFYFKKSDIKSHKGKDEKMFYTVKPLVVKVNDWFDEQIHYSIFIKPKYHYQINVVNADFWVMLINDEPTKFVNNDGIDIEFYESKINYIIGPSLIDRILKKWMNIKGIEEYNDIEL